VIAIFSVCHHTQCNEIRGSDFASGSAQKAHTDGSAAYLSLGELDYRQGADGGQDDPVGGIGTAPANGRNYLSRPAKPGHPTPPAFWMNRDGQDDADLNVGCQEPGIRGRQETLRC